MGNKNIGEWTSEVYQSQGEIHIFSSVDPTVALATIYSEPLEQDNYDNAEVIVKAVNSTYGNNINPLAVPDMLEALKEICSELEKNATYDKVGQSYYHCKNAIAKATL